jgi:hypothetical protein
VTELYNTKIQELLHFAYSDEFDLKAFEAKSSELLEIAEEKELIDNVSPLSIKISSHL